MSNAFKTFKIQKLDPISPSFCAAKWLTSDVYLHTGVTSSCHLPSPHPIDLLAAKNNPLAIHNTSNKIQERQLMLQGQKPSGCSNCWNIEDSGAEISTRVIYSHALENNDFSRLDLSESIVPKRLSIMVDNYCNFDCMYCDATQSTTWATDLKTNGPYVTKSDVKKTYMRLGTKDRLSESDSQLLTEQTVKLVTENLQHIQELTFLGGEPTINPKFWWFLDQLSAHDTAHMQLEVITNFSNIAAVNRLLDMQSRFKQLKIIVSIDGTGNKAEFVRHGLKWNKFVDNITAVLEAYPDCNIELVSTINILSLDGMIELCDWLLQLNQQYKNRLQYQFFILRWPSFQSINVLPQYLRSQYAKQIQTWMDKNVDSMPSKMTANFIQLLSLLKSAPPGTKLEQTDFVYFIKEYSKRRKLNVKSTFSSDLVQWMCQDQH